MKQGKIMTAVSEWNRKFKDKALSVKQLQALERSLQADDCGGRLSLARRALSLGENFHAYDLAAALPDSREKFHILGLALARSGAFRRAREIAERLNDEQDPECAGFRSRIFKDMAVAATDPAEKRRLFLEAAEISLRAFNNHAEYFNGVNAACCYLLGGQAETARRIAERTIPLVTDHSMWGNATLGECTLIAGRRKEAEQHYRKASVQAHGRYGDFGTTVRQLRLLLNHLDGNDEALPEFVELPGIALLAGRNEYASPRQYDEDGIHRSLEDFLKRHNIAIACLSGSGAEDILFAEAVLAHGASCCMVLSQSDAEGNAFPEFPKWNERKSAVCRHERMEVIMPECGKTGEGDAVVEEFHDRYALGLALLKRQHLAFPLYCAYLANGQPPPEVVALCARYGVPVEGIPC